MDTPVVGGEHYNIEHRDKLTDITAHLSSLRVIINNIEK
jgi:hypothetical protein